MFHGVVFGGVQFAIAVMRMAEPEDRPKGPRGGRLIPVPVMSHARAPDRRRRG